MANKKKRPLWVEESEQKATSGTPYANKRAEREARNTPEQRSAKVLARAVEQSNQKKTASVQRSASAPAALPTFQQFKAQQPQPKQMIPMAPAPQLPAFSTPQLPTFRAPQNGVFNDAVAARALPGTGNRFDESIKKSVAGLGLEPAGPGSYTGLPVIRATSQADAALQAARLRASLGGTPESAFGDDQLGQDMRRELKARKEFQDLTFKDVVSDPLYAASATLGNLGYDLKGIGRMLFDNDTYQEHEKRRAEYNRRMRAAATPDTSRALQGVVQKGIDRAGSETISTLDTYLGAPLRAVGWEDNPLHRLNEAMQASADATEAYYGKNMQNASGAAKKAENIGTQAVAVIPDLVLAYFTMGGSGAAKGALTKGGARLAGKEAAIEAAKQTSKRAAASEMARQVSAASMKNPQFWTSFARTAGPSYEFAKRNGATDFEASLYGTVNAILNAQVEIGGGVQTLPWELRQGGSAALAWLKSAVEEGREEVVQGVIERSLQNLTFDAGNPVFSMTDENAIINPNTAAKEFASGAAVSMLLGGPSALSQGTRNISERSGENSETDVRMADAERQRRAAEASARAAREAQAIRTRSQAQSPVQNFARTAGGVVQPAETQKAAPEQYTEVRTLPSMVQETEPAKPLVRGDQNAEAMEKARAAVQPDPVTANMTKAQRADYFNSLTEQGVEHSEAYRRAFGSSTFNTGAFTPENQESGKTSPALEKLGVKISSPIAENLDRKSVVEGNRSARKADRQLKARIKAINPTRAEMEFAQGIANGTYSENDIPMSMDSGKIKELAGLYSAAENNTSGFVQQVRRNIKRGVREKLDGLFASADGVQVPRSLFMYLNTSQRIVRKMFKGESGQQINEYLFDPVDANSAEKIRFMDRMFDRVRDFKLKKTESVLVARVLEGRAAQKEFAMLDPDLRKRVEAVAKSENPAVSRSEYGLDNNDEAYQTALRYRAWLTTQARMQGQNAEKINKAADAYSAAYNDFYEAINDFLVNHGYEPIGFIPGYTPHMQTDEAKTGLSGILQRLGLDPEVGLLPTEIAGRTDVFKPGKQWNPYFLQRTTGDPDTDYDAVEGYESYVNYMSNVLYHTDDIMKLRETGNYFRTRYAKDEVRELIEEARDISNKSTEEKVRLLIRENKLAPGSVLTDEQADEQIESYINSLYQDAKDMKKFGEFVSWLDDYTNRLAGKQTKFDRAIESVFGRRFLNVGNRLTKIFGEATIVGNLSSALNQTAQIPQLIRAVGNINVLHAMNDIITGETRRGDWDKQSDFLTGKRGVDYVSDPSGFQKVMDFAAIPFEAVDDVTSQLYVRAKYVQCIKQGMNHEAAMKAADKFATEMVGSRIQGAKPMVFEIKVLKPFTTFQLEIANNWAYISQDLPDEYRQYAKENGKAKAAAKVSGDILKYLISAWIMNCLADELYGGSPAPLDLIGYSFDAIGAGKGLTGNEYMLRAFDDLAENLTGERKLGTDEMPEGFDLQSSGKETWYNVSRDLPYVNNALAIAGIGKSRMPLPQIPHQTMSDAWNLISGDEEKREKAKQNIGTDAAKELKSWVPMGNQLYKTYTGAKALARGGSFSGSGDKEQMQYQMPRNLMTGAKALLFGANSTKPAREWFAGGYDNLSVKETNMFKQLSEEGVNEREAYALMRQLHSVDSEDKKQENAQKREIITNANISDRQKRALFSSTFGKSRDDELRALARAGLSFKQSMSAYEEFTRIDDGDGKSSEKATEFAAWVDRQRYSAKQAAELKDQFKFWSHIPANASKYEKMTGEGLKPDSAQTVTYALEALKPEKGYDKVTAIQQYNAIVSLNISDNEKSAAIKSLMNDSWRPKYELTESVGITPAQYVQSYQAIVDLRNYLNKGTTQDIAKAAVDSIPGLTNEQRAVLWQIQDSRWKPSKNPYDPRVGAIVVTMLSEKPANNSLYP